MRGHLIPGDQHDTSEIVPSVIDRFTAQMTSIAECATLHIAHAEESQKRQEESINTLLKKIDSAIVVKEVATDDGVNREIHFNGQVQDTNVRQVFQLLSRIGRSHSDVLAKSLLIFGFSTFDAFLGDLLRATFQVKKELIHKLEEKSIPISDLLRSKTKEDAILELIESDISNLLRKSYDEVFTKLANRHGVESLKKFDDWPVFVECSQRRNLITHCDGVVNEEYLNKCKSAEATIPAEAKLRSRLTVSPEYLKDSLDLLYAVGVMLAHTLWRVSREDHIAKSDVSLANELYVLLKQEKWQLARKLGKFATGLPSKKQGRDRAAKIIRLNYAQSLKWVGENPKAMDILDEVDWSSTIRDLRLGVAVLRDNFEQAADFMLEIGKKGELVDETSYRDWPIFRVFRMSPEFTSAFKSIYGKDFGPVPDSSGTGSVKSPSEVSLVDTGSGAIMSKTDVPQPSRRASKAKRASGEMAKKRRV